MLAIVAAMQDELRALLAALDDGDRVETRSGRTLHRGHLAGTDAVLALAGIGKVASATTTALLLERFDVDAVVVVGTAGGLGDGVGVGDLVVARDLLQHDVDATPLFPRWEVPLTGRARFPTDPQVTDALAAAARRLVAAPPPGLAAAGLTTAPRVHEGLVISGDVFVSDGAASARLRADLPDALAVEMEGAAIAQVCHDAGTAFGVVRTVSDRADAQAHVDFGRFVRDVAAEYARDVVLAALPLLSAPVRERSGSPDRPRRATGG